MRTQTHPHKYTLTHTYMHVQNKGIFVCVNYETAEAWNEYNSINNTGEVNIL